MNRYALVAFMLAVLGTPAMAQVPISGAIPPWSPPSPIPPALPVPPMPPTLLVPSAPTIIHVPAGKPLVGFAKTYGEMVGVDGYYPFDTGEYNLAAYAGNTRSFGTFVITLPNPADVDPSNAPVRYRSLRNLCQRR
jgi:hypothetical protein